MTHSNVGTVLEPAVQVFTIHCAMMGILSNITKGCHVIHFIPLIFYYWFLYLSAFYFDRILYSGDPSQSRETHLNHVNIIKARVICNPFPFNILMQFYHSMKGNLFEAA